MKHVPAERRPLQGWAVSTMLRLRYRSLRQTVVKVVVGREYRQVIDRQGRR